MKEVIYWGELSSQDYFYGTEYRLIGKSVHFNNALMPATYAIHTWSSQMNYQATRRPLVLPLLYRGKAYRLTQEIDLEEGERPFLKITFFDRYQTELSYVFIKEASGHFVYPESAYTYQIDLINSGSQSFCFHYLILEDLSSQSDASLYYPKENSPLTIIFQEEVDDRLPEPILSRLGNVYVVKSEKSTGDFNSSDRLGDIEKTLSDLASDYSTCRLVAYGSQGGLAALYYSYVLDNAYAYITGIEKQAVLEVDFRYGFQLDDLLTRPNHSHRLVDYKVDLTPDIPFLDGKQMKQVGQLYHLPKCLEDNERNL